jgi:hypothetical protein
MERFCCTPNDCHIRLCRSRWHLFFRVISCVCWKASLLRWTSLTVYLLELNNTSKWFISCGFKNFRFRIIAYKSTSALRLSTCMNCRTHRHSRCTSRDRSSVCQNARFFLSPKYKTNTSISPWLNLNFSCMQSAVRNKPLVLISTQQFS